MSDQPEAQQPDPAKTITNVSGGVNANAEQINVGADAVGRDKVTSASGQIINVEAGATATVTINNTENKQLLDLDEEKVTRKRISSSILGPVLAAIAVIVAALITAVGGPIVLQIVNRTPVPPPPTPSPTPSCITADDIIVRLSILNGTGEIAKLAAGESAYLDPGLTVDLQAEITPVTDGTLPPLKCIWTNTGIATEGSLLHNTGCKIDYRSGRSVIVDAVSMQLQQSSCPALAPYPFFITPKP